MTCLLLSQSLPTGCVLMARTPCDLNDLEWRDDVSLWGPWDVPSPKTQLLGKVSQGQSDMSARHVHVYQKLFWQRPGQIGLCLLPLRTGHHGGATRQFFKPTVKIDKCMKISKGDKITKAWLWWPLEIPHIWPQINCLNPTSPRPVSRWQKNLLPDSFSGLQILFFFWIWSIPQSDFVFQCLFFYQWLGLEISLVFEGIW